MLSAVVVAATFMAVVPSGPAAAVTPGSWIEIVLNEQRAVLHGPDGGIVREFLISSGASGRTPTGSYRIGRKSRVATSGSNSAVTMAFMTRFNGGIGFHAIPRLGGRPLPTPLGIRPVSHGCIRMADGDAQWIYENVQAGIEVIVTRARSGPPPAPTTTTTTLPPLPRRWSPVTTTTLPPLPRTWTPPQSASESSSATDSTTTTTLPAQTPVG